MLHLKLDHYLSALRGKLPLLALHQQAQQHLLIACKSCRDAWRTLHHTAGISSAATSIEEVSVPPLVAQDEREIGPQALDLTERLLGQSREVCRRAREDLSRLLRLPVSRWHEPIERSRTRFRSRAFVELLVEESRNRVRIDPREAALLAELVPIALARKDLRQWRWARVLAVRAAAHRANAFRIAGDLHSADAVFTRLRDEMVLDPLLEPAAEAEIASLEASLRIGRREFGRAETLLTQAARTYRRIGDPLQLARTLIKFTNLLQSLGRPTEVPPQLDQAIRLFDASEEPYLYFCAVNGRVNALLDLDEARAAGEVLASEQSIYQAGDPFSATIHRFLMARVDLGLERFAEAEEGFTSARDQLLALGRDYDAILASLYLADALLAAGKMGELRRLAAELVPLFRSRGVERETLASLRLLVQAIEAETVSAALLSRLRRAIDPATAGADLAREE